MFAMGYDKTGLGRRISLHLVRKMGRRTLTLGYAVAFADLLLAPFTPSNTARSAGTVYPVIRNLPALYDSKPNDPSSRRIGGYLMWTAIAATCVTSSMFITALAPNLLAIELISKTAKVTFTWTEWFMITQQGLAQVVEESKLDKKEKGRAKFFVSLLFDALAPSNWILSNPAALRKILDTGGENIVKGTRNLVHDVRHNHMLPSSVDASPFNVGVNLATSPGHAAGQRGPR